MLNHKYLTKNITNYFEIVYYKKIKATKYDLKKKFNVFYIEEKPSVEYTYFQHSNLVTIL